MSLMPDASFILTDVHLRLLQRMFVEWNDEAYDGAPAIGLKRPYGNSPVLLDLAEIVLDADLTDFYDETDEDIYDAEFVWTTPDGNAIRTGKLWQLHRETKTALQIVLCTQTFQAGTYQRTQPYDARSWALVPSN